MPVANEYLGNVSFALAVQAKIQAPVGEPACLGAEQMVATCLRGVHLHTQVVRWSTYPYLLSASHNAVTGAVTKQAAYIQVHNDKHCPSMTYGASCDAGSSAHTRTHTDRKHRTAS